MEKDFLDKCTVYSTVVGSVAYGTNGPDSDLDIRGIAVLSDPKYYLGFLDSFEQYESGTEDTVIYDIRKAFKLMADANPNMLDLLFTEPQFHKKLSPIFQKVLDNRDKFLSKRARFSFTGYSFAQLKRIKTARGWLLNPPKKKPERTDFGLPEKPLLSKDDLGAFQWVMAYLLKDTIEYLNLSDLAKTELEAANWIGMLQQKGVPDETLAQVQKITGASDEWMHAMQLEQAYINAKRHFDSYMQWKNSRNKKRAEMEEKFGYDLKHASHLVRLMRMGKEILSTGQVVVFRPDREELKAIKAGAWQYEEVEEYANKMENEIAALYETSTLPKEPDRRFLNKLCIDIIEETLKDSK